MFWADMDDRGRTAHVGKISSRLKSQCVVPVGTLSRQAFLSPDKSSQSILGRILTMNPIKVFVSYSHDSPEHMNRVLELSNRLRLDGIDSSIDQYEMSPSRGWIRWMNDQIEEASFVLVVCTETYGRRFSGREATGTGLGSNWEGAVISQELYDAEINNTKFVPVIFTSLDSLHIPPILRAMTWYLVDTESGYEKLYRLITNQPSATKPEVGKIREMPTLSRRQVFTAREVSNQVDSLLPASGPPVEMLALLETAKSIESDALSPRRIRHTIGLSNSTIVMAMAQLQGPLPDGKSVSVSGEREFLAWRSFDEMDKRVNKACDVLDSLNRLHQKVDVVVFPEYSLPIEHAILRLQEKADQYDQIIIAGGDNIRQSDLVTIYNQAPIIIPGKKHPIWVTKQRLSQWELGLVDSPDEVTRPILTWEANGQTYWLAVYSSLDFGLALNETKDGGGVFVVPMLSPDMNTFRVWADVALRLEGGTASVLTNCIGSTAAGNSCVVAAVPGNKPLQPALELPSSEEAVAVFELDCDRLTSPAKVIPVLNPPLRKRYQYDLRSMAYGTGLVSSDLPQRELGVTKGVINPAIFDLLGKRMRIAFLSANGASVAEKVKDQDFEVLTIFGQHDLMITHVSENRHEMIYDINQVIDWKTEMGRDLNNDRTMSDRLYEHFPFFRVDSYLKVLGMPVSAADKLVCATPEEPIPTLDELSQLMRLGSNWNDSDVLDRERERFLRARWILGTCNPYPGTSAVITIFLEYPGGHFAQLRSTFENLVLPELVNDARVTSIYSGRAQSLAMHYVLRISGVVEDLFQLSEKISTLAREARILISTATYVVARKLSGLSLTKLSVVARLPDDEEIYRNVDLLPQLPAEDRLRMIYLPPAEQHSLISHYRLVESALDDLAGHDFLTDIALELGRVARGLLNRDFSILKQSHDILQLAVEKMLKTFIEREIEEPEFSTWRTSLKIPARKEKNQFSFSERIRLAIKAAEEGKTNSERLVTVRDLMEAVSVRNAFAHADWDRLTVESYTDAVVKYSKFILSWAGR